MTMFSCAQDTTHSMRQRSSTALQDAVSKLGKQIFQQMSWGQGDLDFARGWGMEEKDGILNKSSTSPSSCP